MMKASANPGHDKSLIPPLPPGIRSTATIVSARPAKKFGTINHDSSWITSPNLNVATTSSVKKTSMKRMIQAFLDSMRCSPEEAESKTSEEDRIDCIHVGKLLTAMDEVKICMEAYDMKRGPKDLKYHREKVELLYRATPAEKRDLLSGLLSSQLNSSSFSATSVVRAFTDKGSRPTALIAPSVSSLSVSSAPGGEIEELPVLTNNDATQSEADIGPKPSVGNENDDDNEASGPLPDLDRKGRKEARNSMFWLCYYIRYIYNVHRLVLKSGHDPVDASTMSFMQYLYPYFSDYYDGKDAKSFLSATEAYRKEHFLENENGPLDRQSRKDLNLFLSVLEVVMYLWTPAHKEMALRGELISQ